MSETNKQKAKSPKRDRIKRGREKRRTNETHAQKSENLLK